MKLRLTLFASLLLIFPAIGLLITGNHWGDLQQHLLFSQTNVYALPLLSLISVAYTLIINVLVKVRTGNSPLTKQSNYYLTITVLSIIICWLLYYLNFFIASWASSSPQGLLEVLFCSIIFACLMPAMLLTRALLGSYSGLLKLFSRKPAIPLPNSSAQMFIFMLLAVFGLLGATLWNHELYWLTWLAPLFALFALQLLWGEQTILFSLTQGNYSRIACTKLAGLIVGNLFFYGYLLLGGKIELQLPHFLVAQIGFSLFGLLSLQLGDVLAEQHRGKTRADVSPSKRRPFPIPVVVKKG